MNPDEIPAIVAFLESGLDYVRSSRKYWRRVTVDLISFRALRNRMFRRLTNFYAQDRLYGLVLWLLWLSAGVDLRWSGFEIETEISIKAHHAGLPTAEIPRGEILRTILQAAANDSVPTYSHLGAVAIIGLGLGLLLALGAIE